MFNKDAEYDNEAADDVDENNNDNNNNDNLFGTMQPRHTYCTISFS